MEKKITIMLVAAATLSVAVADATYDWTGGDATFGDGAVTIVCEAETGHVTSLAANPSEGGTITLTGVPMTFADGATLTLATTGTVAFAQKVTALGAFTLARGDVTFRVRAHAAFGHFNTAIASR